MPDPTPNAKDLFLAAVEITDPAERERYIAEACGENELLRQRVSALLLAHDSPDLPGQTNLFPAYTPPPKSTPSPTSGSVIAGRYKLLEEVGEGGMGSVWMAEQIEPVHRKVAVKLVKPGMDSKQVLARFEAERQALAMMEHPNIARVLDGGVTDEGRPYFVMEYVKGVPITTYCDEAKMPLRERLQLFMTVCHAVQHAHQKGIIHRDLKPTNILVCLYDGHPVAKVIDFGLAKAIHQPLTEQTLFTAHGMMVGTPMYMSPEQAQHNNLDVDTRTDVYSLGVILYELLAGSTPLERARFKEAALGEIVRMIQEEEPPKPSTRLSSSQMLASIAAQRGTDPGQLQRWLAGDLDWVVMKALSKERSRRYATASAMANDVARFMSNEPVEACPPSAAYRMRKFIRRHRGGVTAALVSIALLFAGTVATTYQAMRASRAEEQARADARLAQRSALEMKRLAKDEREQRAAAEVAQQQAIKAEGKLQDSLAATQRALYLSQMNLAANAWHSGDVPHLSQLLDRTRDEPSRDFEWHYLRRMSDLDLAQYHEHNTPVKAIAISPDGKQTATGDTTGQLHVWDTLTAKQLFQAKANSWEINSLCYSPDGTHLAVAGHLGKLAIWDMKDRREAVVLQGHPSQVFDVAYSPDGSMIASAGADMSVRLWDATTGNPIRGFSGHRSMVYSVAFTPDGKFVASGGFDQTVRLWNVETGELVRVLEGSPDIVNEVACSPDNRWVAAVHEATSTGDRNSPRVIVWDISNGNIVSRHLADPTTMHALAFSPDAQHLAVGDDNGVVRITDVTSGKVTHTHYGHTGRVWDLQFSHDGQLLVSAGQDRTARVRNAMEDAQSQVVARGFFAQHLRLRHDGQHLLEGNQGGVSVRDPRSGAIVHSFTDRVDPMSATFGVACVALDSTRTRLAALSTDQKNIAVWDFDTKQLLWRLKGHEDLVSDVAFARDNPLIVTCSYDNTVRVWNAHTGVLLKVLTGAAHPLQAVAVSHDGQRVFAITAPRRQTPGDEQPEYSGELLVWNWHDRDTSTTLSQYTAGLSSIAMASSGERLAVGTAEGPIEIWDVALQQRVATLTGHAGGTNSVQFTPGDRRLISGGNDRAVRLWDIATNELMLDLPGHEQAVESVCVSPSGDSIFAASSSLSDSVIRRWTIHSDYETAAERLQATYSRNWHLEQFRSAAASSHSFAAQWHASALANQGEVTAAEAFALAQGFWKLQDAQQSLQWVDRAIALDDSHFESHQLRSTILLQTGDSIAAIESLTKCAALRPKDAPLRYRVGSLQHDAGQLEAAAKSFRIASELDPEFAEAFCDYGHVLVELDRLDDALEALRHGHELGMSRNTPQSGPRVVRPRWTFPSDRWVQEVETLKAVDSDLDAYLSGAKQATPEEWYATAFLGYLRKRDAEVAALRPNLSAEDIGAHPMVVRARVYVVRSLLRMATSQNSDDTAADPAIPSQHGEAAIAELQQLLALAAERPGLRDFVLSYLKRSQEVQRLLAGELTLPDAITPQWHQVWKALSAPEPAPQP